MNLDFEWATMIHFVLHLVTAFALAMPSGWDRERSSRRMGLRTFPLVAVASCGYVLIAEAVLGYGGDAQARILQGLMTGMGFIGGGAILKGSDGVTGTATAASLWATGAVGAAVGYGRYEIAVVLSLASFLTLWLLTPVKEGIDQQD